MSIFNKFKNLISQPSTDDAYLYAIVAKELAQGIYRDGLWAKSLAEAEFDENKAKALYMRMAVTVISEEVARSQVAEKQQLLIDQKTEKQQLLIDQKTKELTRLRTEGLKKWKQQKSQRDKERQRLKKQRTQGLKGKNQ